MSAHELIELIERECHDNVTPDGLYILELIKAYKESKKVEPTWKELRESRRM